MANRHHLDILSGTLGFVLLASSATQPALVRLPWAATSGLHFIDAVANADNYRAAVGGLAIKKSPSSDVREFGRMLWEESIEDTRRLKWTLTKAEPYVVLPSQVSTHYMFVIDELIPVSGDEFDQRFIAQQTASLNEALALAQAYARWGDDFDLKEFAARSVPKIETQLMRIREIGTRHQALALR
jgi:putative membrane protein